MSNKLILTFSCDDRPGIVASVTSHFAGAGFSITESAQYQDPMSNRFFMRTEYECVSCNSFDRVALADGFAPVAERFKMDWSLVDKAQPLRMLVAVSKWGHCLNRLLNGWQQGRLPVDIAGVVSNHDDMRSMSEWYGVPYYHLPVTPESKPQQEAQIMELFDSTGAETLILARYMQILSDDLCQQLAGRAINIHHSFLPGFKGARPYHQAHEKGVKLIGATAHYVTADLDEGPIIEQSVVRVSHAQQPDELVEMGRDVEAVVLNTAVRWHAERRIMLNGNRTVVFSR